MAVPKHKELVAKGFIPAFIFDPKWQKKDFAVPSSKAKRISLYYKLVEATHYGIMWLSQYRELRVLLQARIAFIDAYNAVYDNAVSNSKK